MRKHSMKSSVEEWLLTQYEEGDVTKGDLRVALMNRSLARDLWVEFCDSEDFVEDFQSQIRHFLEMIDEVDG
jgi:hypothetical protein